MSSDSPAIGQRAYRYERKFLVDQLSAQQAQALIRLHPKLFYEPYPPRHVNNLYLDTLDMANYYDNLNGALRRTKVRVRWYGDLFGVIRQPILEFKIKDGFVGAKEYYPLVGFHLDRRFSERYFKGVLAESELPPGVRFLLGEQEVVLCNRYNRRYYASRDGDYRLTLDTGLAFYRVSRRGNSFAHRQVNHREIIVELKYDIEQDQYAGRVAGYFPFRVTKSSKYVQGIERVYI